MVVRVGEEQGVVQSGVGDLVAAGVRDAGDEVVFAEAAQVVSHLPGGDVLGGLAEELGAIRVRSSRLVKPAGQQPVDEQGLQQRVDARVAEPQSGDAGAAGHDDGAVRAVKARAPWMGSWLMGSGRRAGAGWPQSRSAGEPGRPGQPLLGMPKSAGASLMVVSVRSALASLWYCLILVCL